MQRSPRSYGRHSIKKSQWGANTKGSNDELDVSLTQIPVSVETEHREGRGGKRHSHQLMLSASVCGIFLSALTPHYAK